MPHFRMTALWSGAAGLPGYTRFRFTGQADPAAASFAAARMKALFDAMAGLLPPSVNISYAGPAQNFNGSGELVGEVAYSPPAATFGAGAGQYSAPSGFVINWITGAFRQGRKLRGRTFLVPMIGSAFDTAGTPSAAALTTVQSAVNSFVTSGPALIIFSAKRLVGSDGVAFDSFLEAAVTGGVVPDRAAVLRSRRD